MTKCGACRYNHRDGSPQCTNCGGWAHFAPFPPDLVPSSDDELIGFVELPLLSREALERLVMLLRAEPTHKGG